MKYSMEAALEADRLEEQVFQSNYSISEEIGRFKFTPDELVLDAGCGTGVLSRYLVDHFSVKHVDAVDTSDLRLKQAESLTQGRSKQAISFHQQDLGKLDSQFHNKYDTVICRYVLEHCADPVQVMLELKKALKVGGRLIIFDLDGVFVNLWSDNKKFNEYLDVFKYGIDFDLNIGRKLPNYLKMAGFSNICWEAEQLCCQDERLVEEHVNTVKRLAAATAFGAELFGSVKKFEEFSQLYLEEMLKPENTLVFTKYICSGKKT